MLMFDEADAIRDRSSPAKFAQRTSKMRLCLKRTRICYCAVAFASFIGIRMSPAIQTDSSKAYSTGKIPRGIRFSGEDERTIVMPLGSLSK